MNERDFQARHGELLERLRAARGECPDTDALLDWVEGALQGERAATIARHVALCSGCSEAAERAGQSEPRIDDLNWQRTAKRLNARAAAWNPPAFRQRAAWLAAAAAVAAAALLLFYFPEDRSTLSPDIAVTRDSGITLLDPRGTVQSVDSFHWQGIPAPVTYRVEVLGVEGSNAALTPLWQGTTTQTRLRADETLHAALRAALEARQTLQWRVVTLDAEGQELGQSAWTTFELRP